MLKQVFASAVFAGLAAGLIAAALQFMFVIPLLLEGELFETGARLHFAVNGSPQSPAGFDGWSREDARHLLTIAFDVVAYTGFALILCGAYALRGTVTLAEGVLWGLAGFAVIHLAPAFGMPPELPGTVGAELGPRQTWWLATVAATAAGLGLLAFGRGWLIKLAGIVVLALPQVMGAPHLDTYYGVAPPELSALFATRSLGVAAITWALLGVLTAYFWTAHAARSKD